MKDKQIPMSREFVEYCRDMLERKVKVDGWRGFKSTTVYTGTELRLYDEACDALRRKTHE